MHVIWSMEKTGFSLIYLLINLESFQYLTGNIELCHLLLTEPKEALSLGFWKTASRPVVRKHLCLFLQQFFSIGYFYVFLRWTIINARIQVENKDLCSIEMEKGLTFIFKADSSMEKQSKEKLLNEINILQTSAQIHDQRDNELLYQEKWT